MCQSTGKFKGSKKKYVSPYVIDPKRDPCWVCSRSKYDCLKAQAPCVPGNCPHDGNPEFGGYTKGFEVMKKFVSYWFFPAFIAIYFGSMLVAAVNDAGILR